MLIDGEIEEESLGRNLAQFNLYMGPALPRLDCDQILTLLRSSHYHDQWAQIFKKHENKRIMIGFVDVLLFKILCLDFPKKKLSDDSALLVWGVEKFICEIKKRCADEN